VLVLLVMGFGCALGFRKLRNDVKPLIVASLVAKSCSSTTQLASPITTRALSSSKSSKVLLSKHDTKTEEITWMWVSYFHFGLIESQMEGQTSLYNIRTIFFHNINPDTKIEEIT